MKGLDRGPEGRLHAPSWRKGCWKGDVETCCAICYARLLYHPIKYWVVR